MEQVALARLVTTHGTRGEIKARAYSGELEHLLVLPHGEVRREGKTTVVEVESARPNNGVLLIRFVGFDSIERARMLVGGELWAEMRYAAPLRADEYYVRELIGMAVVVDGTSAGTVTAVYDGQQAELIEINMGTRSVLVPFMNEYVGEVDRDQRRLEITKRWVLDYE